MLRQSSKHLLVAAALGALIVPGMALAADRAPESATRRLYDVTWADGVAPGQESVAGEGVAITGPRYDPTWPDGIAPGAEGSEHGQGVALAGARYDATWPDGIAPAGQTAQASIPQQPIYVGMSAAK